MAKDFKETTFYKYMKEEIEMIIESSNEFDDITKDQINDIIEDLADSEEISDVIYFNIVDRLRKKLYECN